MVTASDTAGLVADNQRCHGDPFLLNLYLLAATAAAGASPPPWSRHRRQTTAATALTVESLMGLFVSI